MPLTAIKTTVQRGMVFDVTNHFITRPEHSCFGTTRRRVARVTTTSVYMTQQDGSTRPYPTFTWPRATQVQMDPDGTIRLYGGGAGQGPDDLFLTLTPVRENATDQRDRIATERAPDGVTVEP